jgi:hypothetical protein
MTIWESDAPRSATVRTVGNLRRRQCNLPLIDATFILRSSTSVHGRSHSPVFYAFQTVHEDRERSSFSYVDDDAARKYCRNLRRI